MLSNDLSKHQKDRNKLFRIKMLPILTNHSMKYFFINDTDESTKLFLTRQISEIVATKYVPNSKNMISIRSSNSI